MMDTQRISILQHDVAKESCEQANKPMGLWEEDYDRLKRYGPEGIETIFPKIDGNESPDWQHLRDLHVHSKSEADIPSFSFKNLLNQLDFNKGYAITETGDGYVYLSEYERVGDL